MEALACGTPVIAFPAGALCEVVEHGRTGFLVNDASEMAQAIRRAGDISPANCLHAARERFSADRMIAEHLSRYHKLALMGQAPRLARDALVPPGPRPVNAPDIHPAEAGQSAA